MLTKIKALLTSAKVRAQVVRFVRLAGATLVADPVTSALVHGRSVTWVAVEGALVAAFEVAFRQVVPPKIASIVDVEKIAEKVVKGVADHLAKSHQAVTLTLPNSVTSSYTVTTTPVAAAPPAAPVKKVAAKKAPAKTP